MHRLDPHLQRAADVSVLALPALALCLPSGYSYGAALLTLAALLGLGRYSLWPAAPGARWLMFAIALMGLLWSLDMDVGRASSFEMPVKYLLALACVGFVVRFSPDPTAWMAGVFAGATASGLVALFQVAILAHKRANGFTNEIQYGNLSLLLGVLSLAVALIHWRQWNTRWRVAASLATVLGFLGSLLSQSRGGWLALVLLLPVCLWLTRRPFAARRSLVPMVLGLGLLVVAVLPFRTSLMERVGEAGQEIQAYTHQGDATTSIGQRLAHWRLAWDMGLDRPWLGWGGKLGYEQEKRRRVEAGQYPPVLLSYSHAHNELLDMFAKRGLFGVSGLVLFYLIPLWLFWPTKKRVAGLARNPSDQTMDLTVRTSAVLLVVGYLGFGWTQVFFSHNSGNMFYLFPLIALFGMLHRKPWTPPQAPGRASGALPQSPV